jgi:hypothetical protein
MHIVLFTDLWFLNMKYHYHYGLLNQFSTTWLVFLISVPNQYTTLTGQKYFPTKIFPYIFRIKPLIFITFSRSHSLADFHEILIFIKFSALNTEINIVSSPYKFQIILFLLSLKNCFKSKSYYIINKIVTSRIYSQL